MSSLQNNKIIGSTMPGDTDPIDFDFGTYLTRQDLLTLLVTSAPIQKQLIWMRAQALSVGWKFKKEDTNFLAEKFTKPFTFKTFTDWVHWCKEYESIMMAMIWSGCFGRAIIVHYLPEETPGDLDQHEYYTEIQQNTDVCTASQVFYPYFNGQGYRIKSVDKDGEPEVYELNITDKDTDYVAPETTQMFTFYAHASRIVVFNETPLEMGYVGTSKLHTTGHLAVIQRQMLRSVFVQMKNLAAGVIACRCSNPTEKAALEAKLDLQFNHLTKLFYQGDLALDDVVKVVVPDMKIDQLYAINLIIQKQIAEAANLSIRTLGEEDIASGLGEGGAGISHELVKAEIKEIQRHFQRPIEYCFYLLGKEDTVFVWNEPLVQDEQLAEDQTNKPLDGDSSPVGSKPTKDVKENAEKVKS